MSLDYINNLIDGASEEVRNAYNEIVQITGTPDFYYIPKKQRFIMVNAVVEDLSGQHQDELMELNLKAKKYCRSLNVDTPPYTLGNILGSRLGNGAILTK
ncbi:unnamed protein product [Caenorhabditis bovis]|uniref:Uncharacterized protein n=1 Tax=Caenorhabditis bovis TaxID=2654633 RepID=A0A8S1F9Q6_9PELO|nr:unnamed protein product [Caenorhabditis bovis]